jgi:antitoxin ParD1/3/4
MLGEPAHEVGGVAHGRGARGRAARDHHDEREAEHTVEHIRLPGVRVSGHTGGMTRYQKIAVSLPSRAAENVRRAVRNGHAPSVSAYITSAIEEKYKNETLAEFLDEMLEETGGPMTSAEKRWADRVLGIKPKRTRRKVRRRR